MSKQRIHINQSEMFQPHEMAAVAESKWRPPTTLPNKLFGDIGVDLETRDDGLNKGIGSGWPWKGGYPVGYGIRADNFKGYLPIRHEGGGNMNPDAVRAWLNDVLGDEKQTKVMHNAMYDLGWSEADGVNIKGPIIDTGWVEALLDEHRYSYALDPICKKRLGRCKDEEELKRVAKMFNLDPKGDMWRLHSRHVGVYGETDPDLTRDLWLAQKPLIQAEGLEYVMQLEHDLLPLYMDMRRRGVRINQTAAEIMLFELRKEINDILAEIKRRIGFPVEIWTAESIAKAMDAENIVYPRTPSTDKPSITQGFLERVDHWLADLVLTARKKDKLAGTFLEGVILGNLHNGRVHGEIHPLRSDDGGTVSGRLSMSNPNLQFIPARTKEGKRIRGLFLPEEGEFWCSNDFSQQEPRLLVHFAALTKRRGRHLPGAIEARDRYVNDPGMSYHQFAQELTGLQYKDAKILNLAIIYGRGITTTAEEMGKPYDEVKEMFRMHEEELPFAKAMSEVCQDIVKERGYLKSLSGRRSRFPFWEPAVYENRTGHHLPLEQAEKRWPNQKLIRSRLHKSLNSLIQPSAADQTKEAMRAVYKAGYGPRVLIQVHDELCNSIENEKQAKEIAEIMQDSYRLEVPSKVDISIGNNWGECD